MRAPTCGTNYGYNEGCRCPACTRANTMTKKRWRVSVARHGHQSVDAAESRRMLVELVAAGWQPHLIAAACHLHVRTVWTVRAGRVRRVRSVTADAITRLHAEAFPPARRYPTGPLLAALAAAGVSQAEACRRIGMQVRWQRPTVSETVAELVAVKVLGTVPALIWGDDLEAVAS